MLYYNKYKYNKYHNKKTRTSDGIESMTLRKRLVDGWSCSFSKRQGSYVI